MKRPLPTNQAAVLRLLADGQPRSAAEVADALGKPGYWASTQLWLLWRRHLIAIRPDDKWAINEHGQQVAETLPVQRRLRGVGCAYSLRLRRACAMTARMVTTQVRPVRLRLSRAKGFDLQAVSLATNGLPAVTVTRPHSPFKNRWKIGDWSNALGRPVETAEEAVRLYETIGIPDYPGAHSVIREHLAGRNLACWCRLCSWHQATGKPLDKRCSACAPCHIDQLGRIANGYRCDDGGST